MVELWSELKLTTVLTEMVVLIMLPWFVNYTVKSMNKKQKLIEINNNATKVLTGIMLLEMLNSKECDESVMIELYDLYKALGGNGFIDRKVKIYFKENGGI